MSTKPKFAELFAYIDRRIVDLDDELKYLDMVLAEHNCSRAWYDGERKRLRKLRRELLVARGMLLQEVG